MRNCNISLCIVILFGFLLPLQVNAASTDTVKSSGRGLTLVAKKPDNKKRVALVIGNGKYQYSDSLPKLANPPHDAEDIAAALRDFGFEVIEKQNLTQEQMDTAIAEFGRKIANSEAALFYFAGHGLQVKGQNYLVPVDAKIESEAQIPYKSINVNQLLEEMDNGQSRANIVMLDACRNNPLSGRFRSAATHGLAAPTSTPKGTVIVYATDPGGVAADGDGRNGLFTAGLLTAFKGDDLSLGEVLARASEEVERNSGQKQTPYINGPATLQKNFHFAPDQTVKAAKVAPAAAQPSARVKGDDEIEQDGWESARKSANIVAIREYLNQYPQGRFAGHAKILLATLQSKTDKGADPVVPASGENSDDALTIQLQKQAEAGDINSMHALTQRYETGTGTKKNPAKAGYWRNKAEEATAKEQLRLANAGDGAAMANIAFRYETGMGVDKDPEQARAWRAKANQYNIYNFSYFENTDRFSKQETFIAALMTFPLALASDILSLPERTSALNRLKNEAAFRPATWGKPDSMIARAAQQQKADNAAADHPRIVVATK